MMWWLAPLALGTLYGLFVLWTRFDTYGDAPDMED
jgi:hypothetical protein